MDLTAPLIGIVAGFVVGVTSTGGGALLTPALVFILRVPPSLAVGSDVLIASVTKLFGGGSYALRGQVHWPTVGRLLAGSLPGAALGIFVLNHLSPDVREHALQRGLGAVLVMAGLATLVRLRFAAQVQPTTTPRRGWTAALGFVTGLLVSTTSIGSAAAATCSSSARLRSGRPGGCSGKANARTAAAPPATAVRQATRAPLLRPAKTTG